MSTLKKDPFPTALVGGMTVKTDERIAFFGMTDELSCHVMKVRCLIEDSIIKEELETIVKILSKIMGEVAGSKNKIGADELSFILKAVKNHEINQGIITSFILPGQTLIAADIQIARCVARRTELSYAHVYSKYGGSDYIFEFLNKLSTLLYSIALPYEKTL